MSFLDRLFGRREPEAASPPKKSAPPSKSAQPARPEQRQKPAQLPKPAPAAAPERPAMAPGTRIAHHFELIAQLEQDHRDLLRIYSGLRRASDAGRMQEAGEQLETFRHALQGHLLKENVKLYVYLEHTLAADATSHELMHGFRHEMDRIGKAVMVFLDRYRDLAGHPEWKDDFARELDGIGKVLVERMRNEESNLYPLYGPP